MAAFQIVILLVLATILAAGVFIYAAHVFVTITQQTAGGLDEIAWPKDPWYDWLGQALHLGWLGAFWLAPLGLLLKIIGPKSLAASAPLYVLVPSAFFWLLFPVTLLSSFSANSPWALLRPEALGRMVRGSSVTVKFYLLTAPLCLAGGLALYLTLAHSVFYALPALATVLFLYARLIGRYSRVLGRVRAKGGKPKADPDVRRAAKGARVEDPWGTPAEGTKKERPKKKKKKPAVTSHDPWAVPEEPAESEAGRGEEVETYGIAREEAPPRPAERKKPPPVEGYDVSPEPPPARSKEVPLDGSPPVEPRRIASEAETPLPARPLIDGVFTFPWYPSHLGVWGLLTLLFLVWGGIYSMMQSAMEVLR
jgi:hypothetical protein